MNTYQRFFIFIIFLIIPQTIPAAESLNKKKILYVDSYNANIWSATIEQGIHAVLDRQNNIELKIFRMDTKSTNTEPEKETAALRAKKVIDKWKPDIVIVSDDNAAKYLVAPYFKDSSIPFVFCGINNDASIYGFPTKNITGMVEVILLDETLKIIQEYTKGDRIGFIGCDNLTSRKTLNFLVNNEKRDFTAIAFVKNFSELKQTFLDMQKQVDALFLYDTYSVKDFNLNEMISFARKNTAVPTFGSSYTTITHTLLGTPKLGFEHGEWAATTALAILGGKNPSDFPITQNIQAQVYLNIPIAAKLGIKFPIDLLDSSHLIYDKEKKVLYLNYIYADCPKRSNLENIKRGVLSALNIVPITTELFDNTESDVDFRILNKTIEKNAASASLEILAKKTMDYIQSYKPNVIIAAYSPAIQFFVDKYSGTLKIPIILCGFTWEIYFNNTANNQIIVPNDYTLLRDAVKQAKAYTKGHKLGYIGIEGRTTREAINKLSKKLNIDFSAGVLVKTWQEVKSAFLKLQDNVDIICFFEICKANDWNEEDAVNFFFTQTRVPTIAFTYGECKFALIRIEQVDFEQGWLAGRIALDIDSDFQNPSNHRILGNNSSAIITNPDLKKHLLNLRTNKNIIKNTAVR